MSRLIYLVIAALFAASGQCTAKQFTLTGYIGVEGGESYTYKLVFTDSMGFIRGYSSTYTLEGQDTRSAITGHIDKANRTISFKETEIMYNHGFQSAVTMCLIDAQLRYMPDNKGTAYLLKGTYKSADASATYCGMGTVVFISETELKPLFEAETKTDTAAVIKKVVAIPAPKRSAITVIETEYPVGTRPTAPPPVKTVDEITAGVEKVYEWHSDSLIVDIWDGGNIDGDRITMLYNGKKILTNYLLEKKRKQVRLPVSATGTDVLTIVANNEGSEPPNTANLLLTDGSSTYSIVAYNDIGHEAVISVKKVGKPK